MIQARCAETDKRAVYYSTQIDEMPMNVADLLS